MFRASPRRLGMFVGTLYQKEYCIFRKFTVFTKKHQNQSLPKIEQALSNIEGTLPPQWKSKFPVKKYYSADNYFKKSHKENINEI